MMPYVTAGMQMSDVIAESFKILGIKKPTIFTNVGGFKLSVSRVFGITLPEIKFN